MIILTIFLTTLNLIITGMMISAISITINEGRKVMPSMYGFAALNFVIGVYQLVDLAYKG
jgi:hypothetical protein